MNLFTAFKIPEPTLEYKFHPDRKWRFDYAWIPQKIAMEIEGGVWVRGRHNRGKGFINDMEKYSWAAIMGWCVIRVTPSEIQSEGLRLVGLALTIRNSPAQDAARKEIETRVAALNVVTKSEKNLGVKMLKKAAHTIVRGIQKT